MLSIVSNYLELPLRQFFVNVLQHRFYFHDDFVFSCVLDTDDWPEENRNNCWCIAAASGPSSWRTQTINLLDQGFIPEYLDEMKPAIKVYEW